MGEQSSKLLVVPSGHRHSNPSNVSIHLPLSILNKSIISRWAGNSVKFIKNEESLIYCQLTAVCI